MKREQQARADKSNEGDAGAHAAGRPQRAPAPGPVPALLRLRHAAGNRASGQLLQAKLRVSQPGDEFEQEADRVADRVVNSADPAPITGRAGALQVQRACRRCDEERDEAAGDVTLQRKPAGVKEVGAGAGPAASVLPAGGGEPLGETARAYFEPRFGHDFSRVRLHADAQAAQSARAVEARAYTVGNEIVFGAGQYAPDTPAGKRLLAHELTHVVQNRNDDALGSDLIRRQPATDPTTGPSNDPLRLLPYSFASTPTGSGTSVVDDLFRLGDPLWLLTDVLGDLIWRRPTGKEAEAFKLKGYESAGLFTLGFGAFLGATGLGGEKFEKEGGFGKNFGVWKKYVSALQPLTPSDSAMMDTFSFLLRMRLDEYLASDLFLSRLKNHPFGALALLGAAEAIYYTATGGPGEAGKLTTTPDWNRATGLPTLLVGALLAEKLKPPKFFDLMPLVMKTHPGFAYTPFAGEAPPTELTAEGALGSGAGEGGESYKFATSLNLAKLLLVPKDLEAKDLDDLRKYRGPQSSIWFSFDSLDPTQMMAAMGRLPESKLKAGTLFGAGGHMGMLEMGATYDQPLAKDLTSWFIKGGYGYSGSLNKVADRIGFEASLNEGGTMGAVNEVFLNRMGLTATVMGWQPEYNLAPTGASGAPEGGWAARFTPSLGLDFISGKAKLGFGAALSFVTGSTEDFAVSDVSPYISYTRLDDSSENKLPKFKATVSFSGSRLDWWNKNSPWLYGVQSTIQGGPVFGGIHVMSGAAGIPGPRAAQIDEPQKVQKNTAVLFITGAQF